MLDATPAADESARPQLPPVSAAIAAVTQPRSGAGALIAAARTLFPVLEAGRPLDAGTLRDAMTRAFGASDAEGAWLWKDAYEAAEAAAVLFLQRYGRAMRRQAGAGPDGPRKMLAMLAAIAALEPSHTKRSEQQIRLQQFSTPLPLAYAALRAATVRPGDTVLEPSAGTGMLAVMAQCALGQGAPGHLHLNEIADTRAGLLAALFGEQAKGDTLSGAGLAGDEGEAAGAHQMVLDAAAEALHRGGGHEALDGQVGGEGIELQPVEREQFAVHEVSPRSLSSPGPGVL